ncbi:MAG: YggT family protein [Sphaerochaetaceae bacterium]|nr:YggT family protein [Sphaerochaetaceae bacterium]
MSFLKGICSFIAGILGVYSAVILIRIIVSWIVLLTRRNGWGSDEYGFGQEDPDHPSVLYTVDMVLGKICDPYLNLFRGVKGLRKSNIDLTPLLAFVILNLVRSILSLFSQVGRLTLWTILAIIVDGLWSSLVSFLLIVLVILLIVRLIAGSGHNPNSNNVINFIDPIIDSPVSFVYRLFFGKRKADDQKVVIASLIFYIVLYGLLKWGVSALVNFLIRL